MIKFMWPWITTGLIVLPILWWFEWRKQRKMVHARHYFAESFLHGWIFTDRSQPRGIIKRVIGLSALALIIIGLARPLGEPVAQKIDKPESVVYMVLDSSKSMRVRDTNGSRFRSAKAIIHALIKRLPDARIGLIGFEQSAKIYCPATLDQDALLNELEHMQIASLQNQGSNPERALDKALENFEYWKKQRKIIVFLSDGEYHQKVDWAALGERAAQKGIHILTIGMGTKRGGLIREGNDLWGKVIYKRYKGRLVRSRLKEDALKELSRKSRGRYFDWDTAGLKPTLIHYINNRLPSERSAVVQIKYKELAPYCVGAALILFLLEPLVGIRKRQRL